MSFLNQILTAICKHVREAIEHDVCEKVGIEVKYQNPIVVFAYANIVFVIDHDLAAPGMLIQQGINVPMTPTTMPDVGVLAKLESQLGNAVANAILDADTPVFIPGVLVKTIQEYQEFLHQTALTHTQHIEQMTEAFKAIGQIGYAAQSMGIANTLITRCRSETEQPIDALIELQTELRNRNRAVDIYLDLDKVPTK